MVKKFLLFIGAWLLSGSLFAQIDPAKILKPMEAFAPQVVRLEQGARVQFEIAEGYYLYRSKIEIKPEPAGLFAAPRFEVGEETHDQFFGTQEIYRRAAQVDLPYAMNAPARFTMEVTFQGCADVGICYPPHTAVFTIDGTGVFTPDNAPPKKRAATLFLSEDNDANGAPSSKFAVSRSTLGANLLAFFLAGLGLSFTACMYPLLPIVSSIVLGDGKADKKRAFGLSFLYVQGMALTYTAVGVAAGLTGALLTVWLQQPAVVLAAAAVLVLLALSMFGVFTLQMPAGLQQFLSTKSSGLRGGKALSVVAMGMFSALIIGPCVAPPLAFALGYIGQSGDAVLGGLALYALALGTGVPLILVAVFGAHFLPRAGAWMRGIQIFFGCLMLAAAVYLATPFMAYEFAVAAYALILLVPGGLLLARGKKFTGSLKKIVFAVGSLLVAGSLYFAYSGIERQGTAVHRFLNLMPHSVRDDATHTVFSAPSDLKQAIEAAFRDQPRAAVYVDFYADWCVTCREMQTHTFSQEKVWQHLDKTRFFTIDVTANTPEQQELLKEYGLFGPPGLFVLRSPEVKSEPLLGFVNADDLVAWVNARQ
ncbi:MAG: protein-disulfide reductase DsbD [Neisseria sp.]|nr:protein-disulfide reductase DsbD [Neisseria sp.]